MLKSDRVLGQVTILTHRTRIFIPRKAYDQPEVGDAVEVMNDSAGGATRYAAQGIWRGEVEEVVVMEWWTPSQPVRALVEAVEAIVRVMLDSGEEAVMVEQGGRVHLYHG
jgi:hypothetical protein